MTEKLSNECDECYEPLDNKKAFNCGDCGDEYRLCNKCTEDEELAEICPICHDEEMEELVDYAIDEMISKELRKRQKMSKQYFVEHSGDDGVNTH